MRVILLVALASFAVTVSFTTPISTKNDIGNLTTPLVETSLDADENTVQVIRPTNEDLTYHFFSQNNRLVGIPVNIRSIKVLKDTSFSFLSDTVFLIHGWTGDNDSLLNYNIREAILEKQDVNLFVVDWSNVAGKQNYYETQRLVSNVGRFVAEFITELQFMYWVELMSITLIGFSLGAHVAGCTGSALHGKIGHIVGLDPAGFLFDEAETERRLDMTDAVLVHVIHTNGALLGYRKPCGHSDYFPNGGLLQPGCGLDVTGICSHGRAIEYYAESVSAKTNMFVAYECDNYLDYSSGQCSSNPTSVMGGFPLEHSSSGTYYLEINKKAPFAKG